MAANFTTVSIAPASAPQPVPVVEQDNLPALRNIRTVVQETKRRERQIREIKQRLAVPYDNIRNPEPFLAG